MAFTELADNDKRVLVWFDYDPDHVRGVKAIPGARFVPREKSSDGRPHWTFPKELSVCDQLRQVFGEGDNLVIGERLRSWAKDERGRRSQLRSLATADTAELTRLPHVLPKLYRALHIGPKAKYMTEEEQEAAMAGPGSFQVADVAFGVAQRNPLNGNQPGLGKTLETIGTIFEAGTDDGPTLVIAPRTALNTTWRRELEAWQPHPVFISSGSRAAKQRTIEAFVDEVVFPEFAGWLVVNPDQVRLRERFELCDWHRAEFAGRSKPTKAQFKDVDACDNCRHWFEQPFPELFGVEWANIVLDEAHKNGVRDATTLTAKGIMSLKVRADGKKFSLTGTPMGGRLINLWGQLHFLNPDMYTSKWRWAEMWTDVKSNGFGKAIGRHVKHCPMHVGHDDDEWGRPNCARCKDIEDRFYEELTPYVIRRTKGEVLPWLPPKDHIDIWCDMTSTQESQYRAMEADAEVAISGENVTTTSVLAEYTRLKQFSFGRHDIVDGALRPTTDSGKLEAMEEKLIELGILGDEDTDEQVVIFSQFSSVVDTITGWLESKGVRAAKITGAVTQKRRDEIQEEFQGKGSIQALVMTTTAGGVSITLDRANTVFIVDETWDPDDQEQAEDRVHRASRMHQVTIYRFRSTGTIEEAIEKTNWSKSMSNKRVLDLRRLVAQ